MDLLNFTLHSLNRNLKANKLFLASILSTSMIGHKILCSVFILTTFSGVYKRRILNEIIIRKILLLWCCIILLLMLLLLIYNIPVTNREGLGNWKGVKVPYLFFSFVITTTSRSHNILFIKLFTLHCTLNYGNKIIKTKNKIKTVPCAKLYQIVC